MIDRQTRNARREKNGREQPGSPLPQMPRAVKYAWGAALTALVALSLVLDRGSAWMPLVHRAIDLLQSQTAPIENK